jgi:hypothetical protein
MCSNTLLKGGDVHGEEESQEGGQEESEEKGEEKGEEKVTPFGCMSATT